MPAKETYIKFSPSGKVPYAITNYVAFWEKQSVPADFHPLMDFLKNSPVSYALTASPTIYAETVQEMWSTADCRSTNGGIKIKIKGKSYILTPGVINEALSFPNSNFESIPTNDEIIFMLKALNFRGNPLCLSQVHRNDFRKEWSYFFDTLSKGFAAKCCSYESINMFILRIAYCLLYGKRIDIGSLLLDEFASKFDPTQKKDQVIYYARFLMIIANYLCKDLSIEDKTDTLQVRTQSKQLFASLVTKNRNANVEFVLPEHVRVQISTLYSSPSQTSSLLSPPTMEDVREGYTSPTQVALPPPYQSGTVESSSVSSGKRRRITNKPFITEDGNDEDETEPDVHPPQKRKGAHKERPASSLLDKDHEMPKRDLVLLLEPGMEQDDRQHLIKAASVLKSQLVNRLTSYADKLSTEDMINLANKCYNTLEGLGDNYKSFSSDVNQLIAKHQEIAGIAKKKEDWNESDIKARYNHQMQSLSEVQQRLSSAEDKLVTAMSAVDCLKTIKEELEGDLLKLTEELREVEKRVQTLTAERDECKEAHSVAEAELGELDAEKDEARVAFEAITDQYNAAKKEFKSRSNQLLQLVRKKQNNFIACLTRMNIPG